MEKENKFVWYNRDKKLPPVNVPVLCRVRTERKYQMLPDGDPVRYKFAVHWRMDDGGWDIEETISHIVEWCYIYHRETLITENDKRY